ncbi:Protein FMO-5 [Aphelenchoides avenae]|nr:Protein FMO-5 [Aphelenchus avenae]
MPNRKQHEYLKLYATEFGLYKHIRFNHWVTNVQRAVDYAVTGRWVVSYKDENGNLAEETFDAVIHAAGHHYLPLIPPEWPGQANFRGSIIHSHSYKVPHDYAGKVVVVVGIGNSAVDVAVDLSRTAKQVYLSARHGAWVMNKVDDSGLPFDMDITRANNLLHELAPSACSWFMERKLQKRFDHDLYGLKPAHKVHQSACTLSDDLPGRILSGEVIVKPNIRSFTECGIDFEDDSRIDRVGEVIFCTGYRFELPLLEKGKLIPVVNNSMDLYKYIYPLATADHNTLGLVGQVQVRGAFAPVFELQARVFLEALVGNIRLPDRYGMTSDIEAKKVAIGKRFKNSSRHTIQVGYSDFMDELADMICAKPDPFRYLLTDPYFCYRLLVGPSLPYSYRLHGSKPWAGARDAILNVDRRILKPFAGHKAAVGLSVDSVYVIGAIIVAVIVALLLM